MKYNSNLNSNLKAQKRNPNKVSMHFSKEVEDGAEVNVPLLDQVVHLPVLDLMVLAPHVDARDQAFILWLESLKAASTAAAWTTPGPRIPAPGLEAVQHLPHS